MPNARRRGGSCELADVKRLNNVHLSARCTYSSVSDIWDHLHYSVLLLQSIFDEAFTVLRCFKWTMFFSFLGCLLEYVFAYFNELKFTPEMMISFLVTPLKCANERATYFIRSKTLTPPKRWGSNYSWKGRVLPPCDAGRFEWRCGICYGSKWGLIRSPY